MVGQSKGTIVTVEIPDGLSLVGGSLDSRCTFDQNTNTITCSKLGESEDGLLDCNKADKIEPEPIKFKLKVDDDAPDGDFEIKATISNDASQEKNISFKIKIDANNHPDAAFSCDPSNCDISGCSSPNCCRCYNDALLNLINESTSINPIAKSIWSYKKVASGSYVPLIDPGLGENGIENCTPPKNLTAGDYTVKLRVVDNNGTPDETTRTITYLQGAEAGFSCSLKATGPWYACDDETNIKPDQGSTIWLSDDRPDPLEHSTISDGADPAGTIRTWSKVDVNGIPFETFGGNNSTVTTTLKRLPAIIRLTLNDQKRPPDSIDHEIHIIALPDWIEISPF
jgi:hypothetical protein